MNRLRTRTSKARRWTEALLLLAGLIAIGIWGWSHVRMAVFQSWGNRVLDHSRPSTASLPPATRRTLPIQNGALIGRLEIPRLKMRAVVREGAGEDTLDVALGHIPGTALPGQTGNAGIAGHRDTLFRGLRNIEKDDLIEFQTPAGSYDYKVEGTRIVKPDDVAVLQAGRQPEMTLVTCYPFYYVGSAPNRFIVTARLVEPPPVAATVSAPALASVPAPAPPPAPVPASVTEPSRDREGAGAVPVKSATSHSRPTPPAIRTVGFQLSRGDSREVVPGIRLGVSGADAARRRATVWMFVTPERHRISLKNRAVRQPIFFHGHDDGRQRALTITRVTANSVSGYLSVYGTARTQ